MCIRDSYDCPSVYIGETNDLPRRVKQHKHNLIKDSPNSALTVHRTLHNHKININSISPLKYINQVIKRKIIESSYICNTDNFNKIPGEVSLDIIQNYILLNSGCLKDVKRRDGQLN